MVMADFPSSTPKLAAAILAVLLVAGGCGDASGSSQNEYPGIDVAGADAADSTPEVEPDVGIDARADGGDTDAPETGPPRPPLELPLDETGPYNVGYRVIDVVYQAEADGTDEKRELELSIWYPTRDEDGPPGEYFGLDQEQVIAEAEVAPLESMPLLVFSHGNGGIAEQNYFMAEFWASRGWVMASPSHTGNTLRDGTDINIDAAVYRPQDIRAVLDRILELEDKDPLSGKIDADEIVMSGHSFGGYTTLANAGAEFAIEELRERCENGNASRDYCETFNKPKQRNLFREGFLDPRIDVAVPQAPAGADIFMEGLAELQVPTMLMTGGMDQTLPNETEGDPIWNYMEGSEHRRLNFPRAGHFTFSNMCGFMRDFVGTIPDRIKEDGCGENFIDSPRAHTVINTYALAFARHHFWGLDEAVVDGERQPVGASGFELSVGTQ